MAASIKGFGEISQFLDTIDGSAATVGELSDNSYSFSYDKDIIKDPAKDAGRAIIFHNKNEDGSDYVITGAFKSTILDIIGSIATFDDLSTAEDQFNAIYSAEVWTDVTIGSTVLYMGRHIPSFIIFKFNDGTDEVEFKMWFSDSAFANDYDEWEVRVIPPVDDIDMLRGTFADVTNALNPVSSSSRINKIMTVQNGHPSTIIKSINVTWVDRTNDSTVLSTDWTIVGYGPASELQTNSIAGIRDYLLDNGSFTLEQWVEHFPEIVTLNIYTFIPLWDRPAINVEGLTESIYNPTVPVNEVVPIAQTFLPTLSRTEIEELGVTTMILYKSIGFIVLGEYTNSNGTLRFSDRFTDYTVLSLNDSNINRLSESTRAVMQLLERLARQCEVDDGVATPPADMTRQSIGQLNLITATNSTTHLRMATKASYLAVVESAI